MHRILKDTGSIYLQMDRNIVHFMRIIADGILLFDNEIIWAFENPSGYKSIANKFVRGHDNILVYVKTKNRKHNKQYLPYPKDYKPKGKYQLGISISTVWKDINSMQCQSINKVEGTGYSTQKPKALLRRIIKASSNEGDLVADFYCGSGTTLVVAKELNRNYIGCDINSRAIEITKKRLDEI